MGCWEKGRREHQLLSLLVKGFPVGCSLPVLLAVGIRVAERISQLTQSSQDAAEEVVRCSSVSLQPLTITDHWGSCGHWPCAQDERQLRIWNSNAQVLMLVVKYCLSNRTASIPDYGKIKYVFGNTQEHQNGRFQP